jgi:exodeoxyribonuclease-3
MRIATFNINSVRARLDPLLRWLDEARPDVLCLQEIKVVDEDFPAVDLAAAGYPHQVVWGQRTYNGVAMLSKRPIEHARTGFSVGPPDDQARLVQGTVDGVRILGCYAPNGTELGTDRFAYKLTWFARLLRELGPDGPGAEEAVVVCGDLNITRGDEDVYAPAEMNGRLHAHPVERDVLERVIAKGRLIDTFRARHPGERAFTWWDYRGGAWEKDQGLRIDYMLASPAVDRRVRAVRHWREVRAGDKPSDHVPVTIDLD